MKKVYRKLKTTITLALILFILFSVLPVIPASAASSGDFQFIMINEGSSVEITGYTGAGGEVTIPASIDGKPVVSIGADSFGSKESITSVIVPDSVKTIGEWAFADCTGLKSIDIPGSVLSIGDETFFECHALETVKLHEGLISIGAFAFDTCESLISIKLPESLLSIGGYAFKYTGLEKVTIPAALTSIDDTFAFCNNLYEIDVDENNTEYTSIDGVLFNKEKTKIVRYPVCKTGTSYSIPDGVTLIGDNAFGFCKLTSVSIPEGLSEIGSQAFWDSPDLTEINFSDSLTLIGESAFIFCNSLSTVTIPENVATIKNFAFLDCSELTLATFLGNAPTMGDKVFDKCAPSFHIYYQNGATGFTNPWHGYTAITVSTPEPTPKPTSIPAVTPTATPAFSDLKSYDWAVENINNLSALGIINGYTDGSYKPGNNINRAEFVKLLSGAYKIVDDNVSLSSVFSDVNTSDWFYNYVASAQNEGLVIGNGDGTFSPNSEITREEMFAINARAMHKYSGKEILAAESEETSELLADFVDSTKLSGWARGFAATNVKYGVVIGSPIDGYYMTLNPEKPITRAEAAVVISKVYDLLPKLSTTKP